MTEFSDLNDRGCVKFKMPIERTTVFKMIGSRKLELSNRVQDVNIPVQE